MKVVFAFDSFKGSLKASEACRIAAEALGEVMPEARAVSTPLADGGEGTAEVLLAAFGGEWVACPATGPLPNMTVDAGWAKLADETKAVIETAAASGLTLLRRHERNPMLTSTIGTGELMRSAIDCGCQRIFLAAGGSATVDGGTGAAHALGWQFLDSEGHRLLPCGGSLLEIAHLIPPPAPLPSRVTVLCDVSNKLLGPAGAASVYGPQKGATPAMVEQLEKGLAHLARLVHERLGIDIVNLPGGGAAGGLAAGAAAFFAADLVGGADFVLDAVQLADKMADAEWVVTGEGSFDRQSLYGKVVSRVAALAKRTPVRVAVIAGRVRLDKGEARAAGIHYVDSLAPDGMPEDEALRLAPELLRAAVHRFAQLAARPR